MDKNFDDRNERLLHDIYKNLDMATYAIDLIDGEILNDEFLELVKKQKKIYEDYKSKAIKLAKKYKIDLRPISSMIKMMSFTSVKVGTFLDNSKSHISNKLCQGTSMGIIQIKKAINSYSKASEDIKDVAFSLFEAESKFYFSLLEFL